MFWEHSLLSQKTSDRDTEVKFTNTKVGASWTFLRKTKCVFVFKCARRINDILKMSNPRETSGSQKHQSVITTRERERKSVNDSTNNPRVWFLTESALDQSSRLPIGWPAGMQLTSDPSHALTDPQNPATRQVCEHTCNTKDSEHRIKHSVPFVSPNHQLHRFVSVCLPVCVWVIWTHSRCLLRAMASCNKPKHLHSLSLVWSHDLTRFCLSLHRWMQSVVLRTLVTVTFTFILTYEPTNAQEAWKQEHETLN